MTSARVLLLPDAADDLRRLGGSARRLVAKALQKLQDSPGQRGAPLGARANAQSDLTGFRKLVVGDRDYRIIYEVRRDGTVVIVWVIGKRADAEAYRQASERIAAYRGDPDRQAMLQALLDAAHR